MERQQQGFNCPECGSFIHTSIELLLGGKIYCSSCALALTPQLDDEIKDALVKLNSSQKNVKKIKDNFG